MGTSNLTPSPCECTFTQQPTQILPNFLFDFVPLCKASATKEKSFTTNFNREDEDLKHSIENISTSLMPISLQQQDFYADKYLCKREAQKECLTFFQGLD